MATPFVGEIRMFAGNFAPSGWMFCDGSLIQIAENDTLFNLIGTTYGGDGQSTFALPNLQSRIPIHMGNGFNQGETGGAETVTLTPGQMPAHTHPMLASAITGDQVSPSGQLLANSFNVVPYINDAPNGSLNANAVTTFGGSQPHENMQPYVCINYIISMFGIFPSPN